MRITIAPQTQPKDINRVSVGPPTACACKAVSLTMPIKSNKLSTKVDDPLREPATLFNPGAHSLGIGGSDDARGLRRSAPSATVLVHQLWGMEAKHRPSRDANAIAGIVLSTSVQADRQGPSMITRSPDCRTRAKTSRKLLTSPPGLDRIRKSARTGSVLNRAT